MIINTYIDTQPRAAYYCSGSNDDRALVAFVANLRARALSNYVVEIIGTFGKSSTAAITIDNTNYTHITLDFSKCNTVVQSGAFLNVKNVTVKNLDVYQAGAAADVDVFTLSGTGATFESCSVRGSYAGGACRAFSLTDCRVIKCTVEAENADGSLYGIYGFGLIVTESVISVKSATASAYGIEAASGSLVSNCKFTGETAAAEVTTSGNGGIGGGNYSNCLFIGIGNLKGQGFYVRSGTFLAATNCIFRGYTKNTSTGWGCGLMGQDNDATTVLLSNINCNQIDLSGYSQNKSMELPGGYGTYTGTFYTAPVAGTNITGLASYNRNRS